MVETRWVVEHGEGHWEVSYNGRTLACDSNELEETIREIKEQ